MERDSSGRFQRRRPPQNSSLSGAAICGVSSLATGLALGAVAMYLLDSRNGSRRRAAARDLAERAFHATGDAANAVYHSTANAVGSAAHAARHTADAGVAALHDHAPTGHYVRDRAMDLLHGAGHAAGHAGSMLASTASDWADSARQLFSRRTKKLRVGTKVAVYTGVLSTTAISALVVGAGAMWVFDPNRGRARMVKRPMPRYALSRRTCVRVLRIRSEWWLD